MGGAGFLRYVIDLIQQPMPAKLKIATFLLMLAGFICIYNLFMIILLRGFANMSANFGEDISSTKLKFDSKEITFEEINGQKYSASMLVSAILGAFAIGLSANIYKKLKIVRYAAILTNISIITMFLFLEFFNMMNVLLYSAILSLFSTLILVFDKGSVDFFA
ncbi:MAG: hypothetical protein QW400_01080 [Candidatus Diapherotrites archaeon]